MRWPGTATLKRPREKDPWEGSGPQRAMGRGRKNVLTLGLRESPECLQNGSSSGEIHHEGGGLYNRPTKALSYLVGRGNNLETLGEKTIYCTY